MVKRLGPKEEASHRVQIKRAYAIFRAGDYLSTSQLKLLIKAIDDASRLLAIPDYRIAQIVAQQDRAQLVDMLFWRDGENLRK